VKVGIDMGIASAGASAMLDLEELLATRLLVQGNSGSGKSHLLRRLLEQSAPWVQQAIIDPEGDFVTLAERFGHVVIDAAAHTEAALQRIAARVREHRVSVVLDLEGLDAELQMRRSAAFLGGLFEIDRDHWYPMLVVVDEAQLFAPAAAGEISDEARKVSLGAMTNLMCRGRKRGLAGVIATQRLAKLAKNVAAEASNFLMGRTFLDIDMARAADLLGMERKQAEMFRDLNRGQFIALGPALSRRPLPITIGVVETSARGGSPRLLPLPETPHPEARALIMKIDESEVPRPAPRRMPPPPSSADVLTQLTQLAQSRPAIAAPAEATAAADIGPELDRILREILADEAAAFRPVAVLYQDFIVRCRIRNLAGKPLDLAAFRRKLTVARAGVDTDLPDDAEWDQAVALSAELPEDIQSLFLLLAHTAKRRAPCPPDAEIARRCGSHSPRRARRLLAHIEERGFIVVHDDAAGDRIVTLPQLGWSTAPGNPDGAPRPTPAAVTDLFAESAG